MYKRTPVPSWISISDYSYLLNWVRVNHRTRAWVNNHSREQRSNKCISVFACTHSQFQCPVSYIMLTTDTGLEKQHEGNLHSLSLSLSVIHTPYMHILTLEEIVACSQIPTRFLLPRAQIAHFLSNSEPVTKPNYIKLLFWTLFLKCTCGGFSKNKR